MNTTPLALLPTAVESTLGPSQASALALVPAAPHRDPVVAHLAGLGSAKSRRSVARALALVAAELGGTVAGLDWAAVRYAHVAALRGRLAARLASATVNHALSALRGVLRESMRLGRMSVEDCARACDVPNVKGSRVVSGRALAAPELTALLEACDATTPGGARDAAMFAVAYGAGLRRSELVELTVGAFDVATGAARLIGKGNKERIAYAPAWAVLLVRSWLEVRGSAPGPLFLRIDKAGAIEALTGDETRDRLSDSAVRFIFARLAERAGVAAFSPHDTRRSFISDLLDAGADISTVQQLAGHAQVTTTQRYDRRGETSKRRAVALLRDPSAG